MAKSKMSTRKITIADALGEAFGEIAILAEEMRSWEESIADNFSGTEKYGRISEAADALEDIQEIEPSEEVGKIEIEIVTIKSKSKSRASRRDEASFLLSSVIDHFTNNKIQSDLADELENVKDEIEQVEFPGMYG